MRTILTVALAACVVAGPPAIADDSAKLAGTWKLVSLDVEFQNGEAARPFLGQRWVGYTIFDAGGRTMSVWEAEGRKPPASDEDRAALFRSMNAFSGTYRYEAGNGITDVDIAVNPAARGRQTRGYKLDGNRLEITTPWAPSATLAGSPVTRFSIRFERAP